MKGKTNFGRRFLYAEDLLVGQKFHTPTLTIAGVSPPGTEKSADGRLIDKPVLHFEGKDKALVLCKTNQQVIHIIVGEPIGERWVGKAIKIGARNVKAFGVQCLAIRALPARGTVLRKRLVELLGTPAEYVPTEQPAPVPDDGDDIVFDEGGEG